MPCLRRAAPSQKGYDDLLVMFGDTPLVDSAALALAREKLADGAEVVVMGFRTADPTGYGRLIEKDGQLAAIREHKDAIGRRAEDQFLQWRADGNCRARRAFDA